MTEIFRQDFAANAIIFGAKLLNALKKRIGQWRRLDGNRRWLGDMVRWA